jgi:outer membrane protein W
MNLPTISRASALALLLSIPSFSPALSQMSVEAEAGPFVGGTFFLNRAASFSIGRQEAAPLSIRDAGLRNAITVGVHAGVRLGGKLGLEGTYAWIPTRLTAAEGLEPQGGAVDVNAIRYGLMTTYHFAERGRIQPFAGAGLTGETVSYGPRAAWERHSALSGTVEAGANLWVRDGVFLRVGAGRDVFTSGDRAPMNKLMFTAGLNARHRIR